MMIEDTEQALFHARPERLHHCAAVTGRRLAAATPATGVGVCHPSSSGGPWPAEPLPARCVPPRDAIVAPNPSVPATQVIANAMVRSTAPASGLQVNSAAITH